MVTTAVLSAWSTEAPVNVFAAFRAKEGSIVVTSTQHKWAVGVNELSLLTQTYHDPGEGQC